MKFSVTFTVANKHTNKIKAKNTIVCAATLLYSSFNNQIEITECDSYSNNEVDNSKNKIIWGTLKKK